MSLWEKLKVLLKINSAYGSIGKLIKGGHMTIKEMVTSKTIWGIVISTAVSILQIVNPTILATPVAVSIISIFAALGFYGRTDANQPK